jgi:uncharacterized protein YecT (DUF1311 family)
MISIGTLSKTRLRVSMALVAVSIALGAQQAAADPPAICDKAVSTAELNLCSERARQAADARLNAVFAKAIDTIRKSGQEKPYDPVSWEKALRASQRAWIVFRDADCKGLVPMSWTGGTGTTSAVLECMTAKTEFRTKELVAIYKGG